MQALGAPARGQRALPLLGLVAGASLVLYASFLGTEGDGYRLLRRYGTALYFGLSCIAMLITAGALQQAPALSRPLRRALLLPVAALPLLGLAHVLLPLALPGEDTRNALQNATEWWGGAIFTLFFALLALAWRRSGFQARPGCG